MPAMESWDDVRRWRSRAEAVRRLADGFGNRESRKTLLEVAENYDKLANNLEARLNRMAGLPTSRPS